MVEHEAASSEPGDMRGRIMAHATRLFVASGYHAISMREIAEAAGISKPGLYYHFRDKEDLFIALLQANLDRVGEIVGQAGQQEGTLRAQVSWMLRTILALPLGERAIVRLASQEMAHISQPARADFERVYQEKFLGRIETLLARGVARGELQPVDTRLATWLLLGMAYPFFSPAYQQVGAMGEAIDMMVVVFFDGLAARPLGSRSR